MDFFTLLLLTARIISAGIFLQALYFKITGSANMVTLFSTMKLEPWGRYFVGILELMVVILILIPATVLYGAVLSFLLLIPALILHLTTFGIVIDNDKGLSFGLNLAALALTVFIAFGA